MGCVVLKALGFSMLNEEFNVSVEVIHKRLLTGKFNLLLSFVFLEVLYCCASFFAKRNVVLCCMLQSVSLFIVFKNILTI